MRKKQDNRQEKRKDKKNPNMYVAWYQEKERFLIYGQAEKGLSYKEKETLLHCLIPHMGLQSRLTLDGGEGAVPPLQS